MDKSLEIEIEGHRLVAICTHSGGAELPVFFLHGITGSIYFWTPELTSPFHDLGPCYSLSLPGHFPAVSPKDFPSSCITAEWLARLTSKAVQKMVGNRRVLLVGHSTGGFAALSTAIYHPEVVAGVVSLAGFARGKWTGALGLSQWLVCRGPIGRAIFKTVYRLGSYRALYRLFWEVYASDHLALMKHPHFGTVVNATFPYLQNLDLDAMIGYFTVMPQIDITPCLPEIIVPACLIVGDKDPIVPPKQSATIARSIKNARLTVIKGAGHLPFFERPMEYESAVVSWLAEFQHVCGRDKTKTGYSWRSNNLKL